MKYLLGLFFIIIVSCNQAPDWKGAWKINLELQDKKLPFLIELFEIGGGFAGKLHNSTEELELISQNSVDDKKLRFEIGAHYAVLELEFVNEGELKGFWIRTNKENYKVPLSGKKTSESSELFSEFAQIDTSTSVDGRWEVDFNEGKKGLGIFKQQGSRVTGSILTDTGDYRFLVGKIQGDHFYLQGFDGVFSFIFNLKIKDGLLSGTMYSGKSYKTDIKAKRNPSFRLADAYEMTKITDKKFDTFLGESLSGTKVDLSLGEFKNKPKVIQLFGSWCPNCVDETYFFNDWMAKNPYLSQKINFVALAFENFETKAEAIKAVRKSKKKLSMNYPVILVDYDRKIRPEDILPIDKGRAFPTTLFLDKNNKIVKIHTGFSGPATGPFYEKFKESFQETITNLVSD